MNTAYQDLYTGLGYLFYSVAASDGRIPKAETGRLKELIERHWLPYENSRDEFGTDAAYYIDIIFDYAVDQELPAEDAYSNFLEVHAEHKALFDDDLKRLVERTASGIAEAMAGVNKSERAVLDRLHRFLQQ